MKTRIRPVLMLAVLSPLTAEFLLGDQYLQGFMPISGQLGMLVAFVMFYGMAAVLIREIGRRLRVGWPGIGLMALGFGLLEEGLLTQSLFNPHYLGRSLIEPGHIALLGVGAPWTVFVLSLHVIWSIGSPIAIMEAWAAGDRQHHSGLEPWLGRVAMIICAVVFVVGAAAIAVFTVAGQQQHFIATAGQLIGAAIAAVVAVAVGLSRRGRQPNRTSLIATKGLDDTNGRAPRRVVGWAVLTLAATTAFQLSDHLLTDRWPWVSTAAMLLIWAAALVAMTRSRPEPYAVAAGAMATYAWVGLTNAGRVGVPGLVEQLLLILVIAALIGWTLRRVTRSAAIDAQRGGSPSP